MLWRIVWSFDVTTYFYFLISWHTFWCPDIHFDTMAYLLPLCHTFQVITYFLIPNKLSYILTFWCTFHFIWHTFWCCDALSILFLYTVYVMAYFLYTMTSWRTFPNQYRSVTKNMKITISSITLEWNKWPIVMRSLQD